MLAHHHGVEPGLLGFLRHANERAQVTFRRQGPVLGEDVNEPEARHRVEPVEPVEPVASASRRDQ